MAVIVNGRRFGKSEYASEGDFENDIIKSSKVLFGEDTVYIDVKKKVESKTLGATIPDGVLFDFTDPTDPQFYIVEIELSKHDFYDHIFPQITKFFASFGSAKLQKPLVDKLSSIVDNDPQFKAEFRKHLGRTEIYKFFSNVIEVQSNILLIADGDIEELPEIMDTYVDTWGRLVRFMEIKKYTSGNNVVYSVFPDTETLQYAGTQKSSGGSTVYTEDYHLEGTETSVDDVYQKIKQATMKVDSNVVFNPQRYYISIKAPKNVAYIKFRKKKVRVVVMMPENRILELVKKHSVRTLSQAVQDYYNGPCAAVDIPDTDYFEEIETLIRELVESKKRPD